MVIPNGLAFWTWQLPSGPSQIFARVFLSHARVSLRANGGAAARSRRFASVVAFIFIVMHTVLGGSSRLDQRISIAFKEGRRSRLDLRL